MSQITILDYANVPMGPFTREQVAEKLQKGEVTPGSLAFVEGLAQWTPLREVLARMDAAASPFRVAAPAVPAMPAAPAVPTPGYSYAATMQPPAHLVYAGFWLRFAAFFVDFLVVGIPLRIIGVIAFGAFAMVRHGSFLDPDDTVQLHFLGLGLSYSVMKLVVYWLYFALLESSAWQATVGKRVLGLKVTDLEGRRIGFGQASGRFFGKIISALIIYIGFIMAGVTERKQGLHDMLAGTLVVRNS